VTTAKLHADTFSLMETTENPTEAFAVLSYLVGERVEDLNQLYGGMPARISLQESYFDNYIAGLAEGFPDVDWAGLNWDVAVAGLGYPDNPNHEDGMPSFLESQARYVEYTTLVENNADVDVDAELDQLQSDLQAIFDAAAD
jgi:multiple sugar transport system substrate-binding protein